MNTSRFNYSTGSNGSSTTGFVYFSGDNSVKTNVSCDSSDYLSFSNDSFNSTPQNSYNSLNNGNSYNNSSSFNNSRNYRFRESRNNYNSPQRFRGRINQKEHFNHSGSSNTNNSSGNFGNKFNSSYKRRKWNNSPHTFNISDYKDSSCLDDPWAELNKELQNKTATKVQQNNDNEFEPNTSDLFHKSSEEKVQNDFYSLNC